MSLDERCKAYVKPEVLPVLCRNLVAYPLGCDRVDDLIHELFVICKAGRVKESQQWVLHRSVREVRRHNNNVELTPDVRGPNIGLNRVKVHFE